MQRKGYRNISLVIVFAFILLTLTPAISIHSRDDYVQVASDGASGKIYLETELQITGGIGMSNGGGYITWKLDRDAAIDLRKRVIDQYDGINLSPKDTQLQLSEVQTYIGDNGDVEKWLRNYTQDKEWRFWGTRITAWAPLHENDPLSTDVTGLVGTNKNSIDNIEIKWKFLCDLYPPKRTFRLSDTTLIQALYDVMPNAPFPSSAELHISATFYTIGMQSFRDPEIAPGSLIVVRSPVGEIVKYDVTIPPGTLPQNIAKVSTFSWVENPQILFVLIVVVTIITTSATNYFYNKYKEKAAESIHTAPKKIKWFRWLVIVLLILLWIFYFFPGISIAFFGGWSIGIFSVIIFVLGTVSSKVLYNMEMKKLEAMPAVPVVKAPAAQKKLVPEKPTPAAPTPSPPLPVPAPVKEPAAPAIPLPGPAPLIPPPLPEPELGEPLEKEEGIIEAKPDEEGVPEAEHEEEEIPPPPAELEIEHGYNYIVFDETPTKSYEALAKEMDAGTTALCITTTFPAKLKKEYGLENAQILWLSRSSSKDAIDPKRLDFEITRAISNFMKGTKGGIIVLDGLEYLVVENGFDTTLKFIKKVNDMSSMYDATLVVPVNPSSLKKDDLTVLTKEFDKMKDFSVGGEEKKD